ncbi:hypothetical protein [Bradyrhizobium sp. 18]|uniref:hypothetical protein n=1 Tax=Bradyrhizobium sp. 18 TaxID=2782657 RepID=UPI001FF9C1E7|nr:hypothetical protein [Bradyrhizobium sp. 18]MCK1374933.1 hypothetical protein [Bradyrhizobium sp. 49]MCK1507065.1 hypothetical protein [Bradyrhizobium sp. 18]
MANAQGRVQRGRRTRDVFVCAISLLVAALCSSIARSREQALYGISYPTDFEQAAELATKGFGRLVIYWEKGWQSVCTAAIISEKYIITNARCARYFPKGDDTLNGRILRAELELGNESKKTKTGPIDYFVELALPVRKENIFQVKVQPAVYLNDRLNFGILEVLNNPSARFGVVKLLDRDPKKGEELFHLSRGWWLANCKVVDSASEFPDQFQFNCENTELRDACLDTMDDWREDHFIFAKDGLGILGIHNYSRGKDPVCLTGKGKAGYLIYPHASSVQALVADTDGAAWHGLISKSILTNQVREVVQRKLPVTAPAQQQPTRKAIYEHDLASVLVGLSPRPLGYKFVLLATTPPAMDASEESKIRNFMPMLVKGIASDLQSKIDQLPEFDDSSLKPDDRQKAFSSFNERTQKAVNEAFTAASLNFITQFRARSPRYANDTSLAIALRPCVGATCSFKELGTDDARNRFAGFYEWANSNGMKSVNQAYVMGQQGSFVPLVAALDKGREWHDEFPKSLLQATLVNAVKQSRRSKALLSYAAAELAALSKENMARTADAFDSASLAASRLSSNPTATLQGLSDELGRARLGECVRLRDSSDPVAAGECAGYKVSYKELANCLGGKDCMPPFGGKVNVETLLVKANASLADIASSNELPRKRIGTANDLISMANRCGGTSSDDLSLCLLKETAGRDPKSAQTLNCIQAAGDNGSALANCAMEGLPDNEKKKLECFQNNPKDAKAVALCATRDAFPPELQKMIACTSDLKNTPSSVAQAVSCSGIADNSREAACLLANQEKWADAAVCIAGDKIPPQAKSAVQCATNSDSLASFGVCMVANEATGEAQRIAMCYAEAQGVPAALAVCLAAKNLNQDQRIALMCAAQTNGAPQATAGCVAGKLAIREMGYCKGKKFGEGNCFNENNELRKLTASLGVEIGPKSVAADIINLQLQVIQIQSAPILNAANKAMPEIMKVVGPGMTIDPKRPGTIVETVVLGTTGRMVKEGLNRARHWFR